MQGSSSDGESDTNSSYPIDSMWYYDMPPEQAEAAAAAAAAVYWATIDPYYYGYYQDNAVPPPMPPVPPPYYGYEYMYPYLPYGPYYDYMNAYDPYLSQTEYDMDSTSVTPASECITPNNEDHVSSSGDTDSEVTVSAVGLQAIRSVTDIHRVYDSNKKEEDKEEQEEESEGEERYATPTNHTPPHPSNTEPSQISDEDEDSEEDEESDEEDSEEDEGMATADEHVPHQLSVIYEESDAPLSDPLDRLREASIISEDDSSTTVAVESDGEIDDNIEETVTVRLPLRFKFSRTEEDQDVTTVIVGDSQVVDSGNNVSVTVNIPAPPSRQSTAKSLTELSNELNENCSECESDSSDDDSSSSDSDDLESVKPLVNPSRLESEDIHVSVKDRIKAFENGDCEGNLASDLEDKDVYDEDEVDSGVTSQTDTESDCFNDIRRCGSYKRAATHSRLYRLLHGEDDDSDDNDDNNESDICNTDQRPTSLPLILSSKSSIPDSFPSSGIASPASTPTRRPRSTVPMMDSHSGCSTPGGGNYTEPWSDYASYYNSWDDRSTNYLSPTVFTHIQRTSPFPITIPRCPMTPCPGSEGS